MKPLLILLVLLVPASCSAWVIDLEDLDFESYECGSWPDGWVPDANALDTANNCIALDPTNGDNKTLKFYGQISGYWGAMAYHPLNSQDFSIGARLYMDSDVSGLPGLPGCRGFIGMNQNGVTWTDPSTDLIRFQDGYIYARDWSVLGSFQPNRWYDVCVQQRLEGSNIKLQYWIDGENLGERTVQNVLCSLDGSPMQLTPVDPNLERSFGYIRIGSQAGTTYFDDVRILTHSPLPTPTTRLLADVPNYRNNYSCVPTACAMLLGYWDRKGFGRLVEDETTLAPLTSDPQSYAKPTGPELGENGYVTYNAIVDKLIATEEHHKDYWVHDLGWQAAGSNHDPMKLGGHEANCLSDFLGSNQGSFLKNGETYWDDNPGDQDPIRQEGGVEKGLKKWVAFRGYDPRCVRVPPLMSANFNTFKQEIEEGAPVVLHTTFGSDNYHSVLGYGYWEDALSGEQWVAVMDEYEPGILHNGGQIDQNGVEWWKWSVVRRMNTFWISTIPCDDMRFTALCDTFDRTSGDGLGAGLGYGVVDASPDHSGQVNIVERPGDSSDYVLQMVSPTGAAISVTSEIDLSKLVNIEFAYLFLDSGKIDIFLDDTKIFTLISPADGDGAPGSGTFGKYSRLFDIANFGLDPMLSHELRLSLSSTGDPTIFLDDLMVAAVPEPATVILLIMGTLTFFVWARRRRAA